MNRRIIYSSLLTITFIMGYLAGQCIPERPAKKDNSKISVVVIDPGHGGKDFGASVGNAREKDIVLDIALKLGNDIKSNFPDIKVVYTRSNDIFIPLHKRAEIANKNEADLFISIHVNAVDVKSVQGTETFVLGLHRNNDNLEVAKKENAVILLEDDYNTTYEGFDPNQPESYIMFETMQEEFQEQSVMFASNIQNQFRNYAKRIDRSVKMAGFLVLRRTTMPSVLIETGFLSHTNERNYLQSDTGKTNLALAIYQAFTVYKSEIEEKSKFILVTNENPVPVIEKNTIEASVQPLQIKTEINETENPTNIEPPKPNPELYFSVQIMALKKKLEPTPDNFKGEKDIFRIDAGNISRYYSGKFDSLEKADDEKKRISNKFENSFVVAFENQKLISVKNIMKKR
ncbi:N-acetylmuramoyl-L-alanine amidase [Prolixibacteraceae bacterium Z1-6]|uniref:N-acetylmuramoyl-L-alanine amidase n=1 Tax=Draconibacterium aestuarii TaxID=2998507 RepID=A0A9X3F6V8_9BACT|nr:N-acetylmuramoyl-L-alanine amidase [Prolixibacteraceae bacterium Z1-6]